MHVFTAQLAFSLSGLLGLSKSSSRNMVTACNNLGCPAALALAPRLDKKLLLFNPVLRHCVQYVLSCFDGLQALASPN